MLNQPTMEKLQAMKLYGMAPAFREQYESADSSQLSFEERFGLLVDCQWTWKENRALTRRLQLAKFKKRGDRGHRLPALALNEDVLVSLSYDKPRVRVAAPYMAGDRDGQVAFLVEMRAPYKLLKTLRAFAIPSKEEVGLGVGDSYGNRSNNP